MLTSNCCGAIFYEPGYPENDICSYCNEHADAIRECYNKHTDEKVGAEPYPEYDEEKKQYKYPNKKKGE